MENEREDIVVVMAGYQDEMEWLLRSNPGLQSRVRHHISFKDFDALALMQIFEIFCEEQSFILTKDAKQHLQKVFCV
jgi:hypothetical protein